MDDAADHPPVVNTRHPAHLVRQQRPQPFELRITQPELTQRYAPATAGPESNQRGFVNPVHGFEA